MSSRIARITEGLISLLPTVNDDNEEGAAHQIDIHELSSQQEPEDARKKGGPQHGDPPPAYLLRHGPQVGSDLRLAGPGGCYEDGGAPEGACSLHRGSLTLAVIIQTNKERLTSSTQKPKDAQLLALGTEHTDLLMKRDLDGGLCYCYLLTVADHRSATAPPWPDLSYPIARSCTGRSTTASSNIFTQTMIVTCTHSSEFWTQDPF
ncbi:hypothetical protein QBC46DRAFT_343328 [Diplogelasinospora grovesii]|uniref:Uncharacterized protein n=1 Tax=Diplogelasinospora grovesii TaxID=303347 RepID=A0AAN6S2E6_9PEZI|nr:hypothetical protein QBC46DRAFT_343328 [Diplogelasinospora grovesii]